MSAAKRTADDEALGGAYLVALERVRHIVDEGFTPARDARYTHGELADAAYCYLTETMRHLHDDDCQQRPPSEWPFGAETWKPSPADPIVDLVKAGALIAAEIDRRIAAGHTDVPPSPTSLIRDGAGGTHAGEQP